LIIEGKKKLKMKFRQQDSPPIDGKANAAVVEVLAKHFKVAKSSVKIVGGERSRNKVVEISIL